MVGVLVAVVTGELAVGVAVVIGGGDVVTGC